MSPAKPCCRPFPRTSSSVSSDARTPTTGENALTINVRVSSLPSATLDRGLAVEDRPKRARDKEDRPFGELDRDNIPDNVLDLDARIEGLEGRKERIEPDVGVSDDSSVAGGLVLRTSSGGSELALRG